MVNSDTSLAEVETRSAGEHRLVLENVISGYRGTMIVRGVELEVPESGIVAIVGPNGSGKSTLIKTVFGLVRLGGGSIRFGGRDLAGFTPAQRLLGGIGYVPQLPSVFPSMSVQENLEMGLYCNRGGEQEAHPVEYAYELFPQLAGRRTALARSLSGGERRMLEISRSMLLRPTLLLLDEPSVGLSPALTRQMFDMLVHLRETAGVSLLVIEQNAKTALEMCDEGVVLVAGKVAYRGTGTELLADDEVRRSFLGGSRRSGQLG